MGKQSTMKRNLIYHTHISADTPVCVKAIDNHQYNGYLNAIGRDGATLTCDRNTLDSLLPNCSFIAPKQPAKLSISFQLDETEQDIQADCEVIYVRRISRDQFALELRFKDLDDQGFAKVDGFVGNVLQQGQRLTQSELRNVA